MTPSMDSALTACLDAADRGDARAFWLAHMRLEGAMMRLATEMWEMRPKPTRCPKCGCVEGVDG